MKIIALSGRIGSGKSFVAGKVLLRAHNSYLVMFAKALKDELVTMGFSWEDVHEKKPPHIRALLQALGNARRAEDENYWVRPVLARLEQIKPSPGAVVAIDDLRFPNEGVRLREWAAENGADLQLVRLYRPDKPAVSQDISETAMDHWDDWDMIVTAQGGELHKLRAAADALVSP